MDKRQRRSTQPARRSSNGQRRTSAEPITQKKKRRRRRRKRVRPAIIGALFMILIAMLAVCAVCWIKYRPTKDKYDLNAYFEITEDTSVGVTVDNEVLEAQAIQEDDQLYISYEILRDYINDRFYWDANENILLYTLPKDMVRAEVGSKDYTISKNQISEDYVIVKTEGHTAYIALEFVKKYTDLEYTYYEDPSRVMIKTDFENTVAKVKKDTQIRLRGGVKSPILKEVAKDEKVYTIDEIGGWKQVRTEDGIVGYLKESALKQEEIETVDRDFVEEEFTSISSDKTINLAWHQVTSKIANASVLEMIANTKGLTTISPTWFSVANNSGDITSIATADYVNYAHQAGIDVWALVDNFGSNIDQVELLSHTSARSNMINQLVSEAIQYGIDGINVDFEKIPEEAGEHYIQFIRELSVRCRVNHLVLSVDNYVPKGYNGHYHRKEQGIVADYVIIMGYDEHFSGSYEAGSVASYNYVKEGIEETLKDVPAEKVINAIPFYTRLWNEREKTEDELKEEAGTEAANYNTKVVSEALGMEAAAKRIESIGAEVTWDEVARQNYAEWQDADGSTYKIWLEDASSIEEKLELMKDNHLAGCAAWKLGFEDKSIWDLIIKYVN